MFDKRLADYCAMGYERADADCQGETPREDGYVIEYEPEALDASDTDLF